MGFLCARLNADGTLDTTFDGPSGTGDGIVWLTRALPGGASSVSVLSDGKIVVAGNENGVFSIARLNADGTYDLAFDGDTGASDGFVTTDVTAGATDWANGMLVQSDGRYVLVGESFYGGTNHDFAVARYNVDGTLDTSFDGPSGTSNGMFAIDISSDATNDQDRAQGIVQQPDGRLVVVGYDFVSGASNDVVLVRLNGDGSLDAAFDDPAGTGNGKFGINVSGANPQDLAYSVALLDDGRILVGGTTNAAGLIDALLIDALLIQLQPDGSFDLGFDGPTGTGTGKVTANLSSGDLMYDIALLTDGRVVGVGSVRPTAFRSAAAYQWDSTRAPDWSVGTADWGSGASGAFGACIEDVGAGGLAGPVHGWTPAGAGNCTIADSTVWHGIPQLSNSAAKVAATPTGIGTATAALHFGLRTAVNQPPGVYLAPVRFEVVAPEI